MVLHSRLSTALRCMLVLAISMFAYSPSQGQQDTSPDPTANESSEHGEAEQEQAETAKLQDALKSAESEFGKSSAQWLNAGLDLSMHWVLSDKEPDKRQALLKEVFESIEATNNTGTLQELRANDLQAQSFGKQGKHAEALKHWTAACELAERLLGERPDMVANMFVSKAGAAESANQAKVAVGALNEAFQYRDKVGHNSVDSTFILRKLAMIHRLMLKDSAKAIEYQKACLDLHNKLGSQHTAAYLTDIELWGNLHRGFNSTIAISSIEELVERGATFYPAGSQEQLDGLVLLATVYDESGEKAKAVKAQSSAMDYILQNQPVLNHQAADVFGELILMHKRLGDEKSASKVKTELDLLVNKQPPSVAQEIAKLKEEILQLRKKGQYQQALQSVPKLVDLERKRAGDDKALLADALMEIVRSESIAGNTTLAEKLCREVIDLRSQAFGAQSRECADAWYHLGMVLQIASRHSEGLIASQTALDIRRTFGKDFPPTIESLMMVGSHYSNLGDLRRARQILEEARVGLQNAQGPVRANLVSVLLSLALNAMSSSDWKQAIRYMETAEVEAIQMTGKNSLMHNLVRGQLATGYAEAGDLANASALLDQVVQSGQALEAQLPQVYGAVLSVYAVIKSKQMDNAEALKLAQQASAIFEKIGQFGQKADIDLTVAHVHEQLGDDAKAIEIYRSAFQAMQQHLPKLHARTAFPLEQIARLELKAGREDKASEAILAALKIRDQQLSQAFGGLSERQQLTMLSYLRSNLDLLLSMKNQSNDFVYANVLRWKGQAFAAQRSAQLKNTAENRELKTELRELAGKITQVVRTIGSESDEESIKQLRELIAEREKLEAKLAFVTLEESDSKPTADSIAGSIPEKSILIDFLIYKRYPNAPEGKAEQHIVGFVVSGEKKLKRVELGPAKPVLDAINDWRSVALGAFVGVPPAPGTPSADQSISVIDKSLWQPFKPEVKSFQSILISPDGDLGRFPFAALPGSKPNTYLLQDVAVSVVAVPAILPQTFGTQRTPETNSEDQLLLVGDIDYDAPANLNATVVPIFKRDRVSQVAPSSTAFGKFQPITLAQMELESIRQSWTASRKPENVVQLSGNEATEGVVRFGAAKANFLHFCSHGYSDAPDLLASLAATRGTALAPSLSEEVQGWSPGVLAGLALTGANRDEIPENALLDDGHLTAAEVASLDLQHVELVVLSACQTAIGKVESGEGMLGLQRAFQIGGAKTVVSSLWPVNSEATQALMTEFYKNLWVKKLGRVESLRQAQLYMLQQFKPADATVAEQRGSVGKRDTASLIPTPKENMNEPFFWAGFQLSGDFR